jgi:formylmethanofuran dehydrogenase subunit E
VGYKVATAAMHLLGVERPRDEELVAIVENNSCAVDAIQVVTGCTFGKGNLAFRDYGKIAFSFFSRERKKGFRIRYRKFPTLPESDQARMNTLAEKMRSGEPVSEKEHREHEELRKKLIQTILDCDPEECLDWELLDEKPPHPARVRPSVICESCGEQVMETRIQEVDGKKLCIPCSTNTDSHRPM